MSNPNGPYDPHPGPFPKSMDDRDNDFDASSYGGTTIQGSARSPAGGNKPPGSARPGGPQGATPSLDGSTQVGSPGARTDTLQKQIDDTVGVMRDNIKKVSQRGDRLDVLQDKTDNLAVSAQGFRRGANRVRKQMWWKDVKMRFCLIGGVIILILLIVLPVVLTKK